MTFVPDRYTKVTYTSPIKSLPNEDKGIVTFVSQEIFWACNECSALVMDQAVHDWWHRNYLHRDDVKPWWRRKRNG